MECVQILFDALAHICRTNQEHQNIRLNLFILKYILKYIDAVAHK